MPAGPVTPPGLPNLFVPGAGKSGTTSLHEFLSQHPSIFMSNYKEPQFFSNDDAYPDELPEYLDHFVLGADAEFRGESSTTYMVFSHLVVPRIAETITDPRFIFILRNPIERVWSHYRWLAGRGEEKRPLRVVYLADKDDVPDYRVMTATGAYRYLDSESRYGRHISRFAEEFGLDRICVVTTEEMAKSPEIIVERCTKFLGLPPIEHLEHRWENPSVSMRFPQLYRFLAGSPTDSKALNRLHALGLPVAHAALRSSFVTGARDRWLSAMRKTDRTLPENDRQWIREQLGDDVEHLRELLGMSFSEWSADFPPASGSAGETGDRDRRRSAIDG